MRSMPRFKGGVVQNPTRLVKPFLNCGTAYDAYERSHTAGEANTLDDAMALAEIHRTLACPHYEVCLVVAAKQNWGGFTCRNCEYHDPQL